MVFTKYRGRTFLGTLLWWISHGCDPENIPTEFIFNFPVIRFKPILTYLLNKMSTSDGPLTVHLRFAVEIPRCPPFAGNSVGYSSFSFSRLSTWYSDGLKSLWSLSNNQITPHIPFF